MKQLFKVLLIVMLTIYFIAHGTNYKNFTVLTFESKHNTIFNLNFKVYRSILDSFTYTDYGIICLNKDSSQCSLTFKHTNRELFILDDSCWNILIDSNLNLKQVYLSKINKMIRPVNRYTYFKDTLYSFTCRDERYNFNGDDNEYFINFDKGIVLIKNSTDEFKRKDYYPNNWDFIKILKH